MGLWGKPMGRTMCHPERQRRIPCGYAGSSVCGILHRYAVQNDRERNVCSGDSSSRMLLRMTEGGDGILHRFAVQNDGGERAPREAPLQGEEKRRGDSRIARAGGRESRGEGPSGTPAPTMGDKVRPEPVGSGRPQGLPLRRGGEVRRKMRGAYSRSVWAMRRISRTI